MARTGLVDDGAVVHGPQAAALVAEDVARRRPAAVAAPRAGAAREQEAAAPLLDQAPRHL